MSKYQRAYDEFDSNLNKEFTGLGEFMEKYGAKLLKQFAVIVTTTMALFVGLFIFFG